MTNEDNNNEICDHRAEDSKECDQDGHRKNNNKTSKRPKNSEIPESNRTDAPKKSLSFFPSVEDSGDESLDGSDGEDLSLNKRSTSGRKSSLDSKPSESHGKVKLGLKSAVPIESDHDDASSTSSCSCEDHSSAGGQFDDDGHGDLDYDDDSITNSPIDRHGRLARNVDLSEPSAVKDTTNDLRSRPGKSNGFRPLQSEDQERLEEDTSQAGDQTEICSERPAKIRSFINFHSHDEKDNTANATRPHKERSHKSYEGMLKYFFKDACYFQIKSINHENVAISKAMGVWSTPMQNEIRLNTAFREHRNVILIFSVQQSGAFQGFARMTSESRPATRPVPWVLPERLSNASLGGVFQVQWLCAKELNFNETRDLRNPFNNDKPVKVARDGQQVEPKVGKKLCSLFPRDSKKRLLACVEKLKLQTRQRKQLLQKRNSYYPLNDARAYNSITQQNRHNINFAPQPTVFNGYEDMSISTSSQNHVYPNHHDFGDMRIPSRRRGPEHIAPSHYVRRRQYPSQSAPSYNARSSHYNQVIGDTSPSFNHGFANIPQAEFYPDHYGQHHQYPGPIPPGMTQPHSRSYYDWSMTTQNPVRYHPYQRARR